MNSPKKKDDDKHQKEDLLEMFENSEDNQSKSAKENKDRLPDNSENAVPPKAWKNQKKAYDDAWENNKNKQLDNDF